MRDQPGNQRDRPHHRQEGGGGPGSNDPGLIKTIDRKSDEQAACQGHEQRLRQAETIFKGVDTGGDHENITEYQQPVTAVSHAVGPLQKLIQSIGPEADPQSRPALSLDEEIDDGEDQDQLHHNGVIIRTLAHGAVYGPFDFSQDPRGLYAYIRI